LGLNVLGSLPVGHSEPHYPLFLNHPYSYDESQGALVPSILQGDGQGLSDPSPELPRP
jgi:hypothetical protein